MNEYNLCVQSRKQEGGGEDAFLIQVYGGSFCIIPGLCGFSYRHRPEQVVTAGNQQLERNSFSEWEHVVGAGGGAVQFIGNIGTKWWSVSSGQICRSLSLV